MNRCCCVCFNHTLALGAVAVMRLCRPLYSPSLSPSVRRPSLSPLSPELNRFHLNFLPSHLFLLASFICLIPLLVSCHSPHFLSAAFVALASSKLQHQRPYSSTVISLFDCEIIPNGGGSPWQTISNSCTQSVPFKRGGSFVFVVCQLVEIPFLWKTHETSLCCRKYGVFSSTTTILRWWLSMESCKAHIELEYCYCLSKKK